MGVSVVDYAAVAATVVLAYTIFGLTGFGAAMVAVPLLVQVVPLKFAVPLIVLLDILVTAVVSWRNWSHVSWRELRRLFPFMLLGVALGATMLANLGARWLLIGLGVFILAMALRSLRVVAQATRPLHAVWVVPAGTVGGIFSALFGTGGPIYTMYLSRRLVNLDAFRATIAAVIFLSAVVRIGAFGATGLLQQDRLLAMAAFALPACLLGTWLGSSLRRRVSPLTTKKALLVCMALGGCIVLVRGLLSP